VPGARLLHLYLDTSVYGGCYDAEFERESNRLVAQLRRGLAVVVLSELVIRELASSPAQVRDIPASFPGDTVIGARLGIDVRALRDRYVAAGIVRTRSLNDATHVALATVAGADALVSWNFKDIVRLDRMQAYNRINMDNGYAHLQIVSPQEVDLDAE
jgi:predicted nucleic acid-binding protein